MTIIFYVVFSIYLYIGISSLNKEIKINVNTIFTLLCFSMAIWTIGYGVSLSAPSEEAALLWKKISALGWTSFNALILHFVILLHKPKAKLSQLLLYLPSLFFIFIYVFYPPTLQYAYILKTNAFGWQNMASLQAIDIFFYLYQGLFTLLAILNLYRWSRVTTFKLKTTNSLVKISIIVYLLSFVLEYLTKGILGNYYIRLSTIIILAPTLYVFYSIRKHQFLHLNASLFNSIILDSKLLNHLMDILTISLLSGATLNFISDTALLPKVVASLILSFFSVLIQVLKKMKLSNNSKSLWIVLIIYTLIPLSNVYTFNRFGVTTWTGQFIVIILFSIFNSRKSIVFLSVGILINLLVGMTYYPKGTIVISQWDYLLRIIMFFTLIILSIMINQLYIKHISERNKQLQTQNLISEIASLFIPLTLDNQLELIHQVLGKIGHFYHLDRAYITLTQKDKNYLIYLDQWTKKDDPDLLIKIKQIPLERNTWGLEKFYRNEVVSFNTIDQMPKEAAEVKEVLKNRKTQSLASIPIWRNNSLIGVLGLESLTFQNLESASTISGLKIIAKMLGDAILRVEAERQQEELIYTDGLTGLSNRQSFRREISNRLKKKEGKFAVFFLDLDRFKIINDTKGHEKGDLLLKQVAERLKRVVNAEELLARFGGDEFLIIQEFTHISEIQELAIGIKNIFKQTFIIDDHEFYLTVSMGISRYPEDGNSENLLVKNADLAMYEAKAHGKNQYVLCTNALKSKADMQIKLSNDLQNAIENKELYLVYQPQVNIETQELIGMEALIRWNHRTLGPQSPSVFIPLAEKNGLINQIGTWVLETAIQQNTRWKEKGYKILPISVNVSINQLRHHGFVQQVKSLLDHYQLRTDDLELEITESILIENTDSVVESLTTLKNMGVRIAIDDFGTGYSSLSRIKDLPIDRLKMDIQFVRELEFSEKDRTIAQIIIDLADKLDLNLIAEGVETEGQIEILKDYACREVQGYAFYKPMSPEDLEALLKHNN